MKILIVLLILMVVFSCQEKKKPVDVASIKQIQPDTTDLATEKPEYTLKAFLSWYRKNYTDVNQYELLNEIAPEDTSAHEGINFKETGLFLAKLQSSNYLSDQYIANLKQYFSTYDAVAKKRSNETIEDRFNEDLILRTNEIEAALNSIDKMDELHFRPECSENTASVRTSIQTELIVKFSRSNNKWLIDSIDPIVENDNVEGGE